MDLRVLAWPAVRKRQENPYTFLLQESTGHFGIATSEFSPRNLLRRGWNLIHIHWPEIVLLRGNWLRQALSCTIILLLLRIQKLFGAKVVWTVHNLQPHEIRYPRLSNAYLTRFTKLLDGYMSPSEYGLRQAAESYPALRDLPRAATAIGHYRNVYPAPLGARHLREKFGVADDALMFVSIGQIRGYKGYGRFAEMIADMDPEAFHYVVVGKPHDQVEVELLTSISSRSPNVHTEMSHVPDQMVADLLDAADYFAAPFQDVLHSSSVLLALSFSCQVIAPRFPVLEEVSSSVGPGWLRLYDGELSPSHLQRLTSLPTPDTPPDLTDMEWNTIGERAASFFKSVVDDDH